MTNILLAAMLVLLVLVAVLNMALYVRVVRKEQAVQAEERVQNAMDEAAAEDARKGSRVDEGVENIMSYSVKLGRGMESGGEP